jgi:hypothetical protein
LRSRGAIMLCYVMLYLRKRLERATAAHHECRCGVDGRATTLRCPGYGTEHLEAGLRNETGRRACFCRATILRRRAFGGTAAKDQSASSSSFAGVTTGLRGTQNVLGPLRASSTTWTTSDPHLRETLSKTQPRIQMRSPAVSLPRRLLPPRHQHRAPARWPRDVRQHRTRGCGCSGRFSCPLWDGLGTKFHEGERAGRDVT